jgi:hypothetical protein
MIIDDVISFSQQLERNDALEKGIKREISQR